MSLIGDFKNKIINTRPLGNGILLLLILPSIFLQAFSSCATDIEKRTDWDSDAIVGNVKSIFTYGYMEVDGFTGNPYANDLDLIIIKGRRYYRPLFRIYYNLEGYRDSCIWYIDSDIATLSPLSLIQEFSRVSSPGSMGTEASSKILGNIYDPFFVMPDQSIPMCKTKYYYGNDGSLTNVFYQNAKGEIELFSTVSVCKKENSIIDSIFYPNGGLKSIEKYDFCGFNHLLPEWMNQSEYLQFNNMNDLIVDGDIHYYYTDYDQNGNWTKAVKYLEGPKKEKPVKLARVISYY